MYARTLVGLLMFLTPVVALGQMAVPAEEPVTIPELYAGGPAAPVVRSTAAGVEGWYPLQDLTFTWNLPSDVTAVAAELFTESGQEPQTTFRPPVTSITIPESDLVEGQHYLSVQFRNEQKWGMYADLPIRIDNTPPLPFSITLRPLDGVRQAVIASFETHDDLSGVSYYELIIGNQTPRRISTVEASAGVLIDLPVDQALAITVVAFDRAGNEARTSATLFGGSAAGRENASELGPIFNTDPIYLLAGILAAMMLLTFGYMVFQRQRYAWALEDLRKETDDVQAQLLRIFSALREEIYEQINNINSKKRLSKGEKSAIDSLNQALLVSETLIEREVKDVKKLLD